MNLFISKTMFTLNAFKIVIYRQFIIFTLFIFRHLKSYPIRFLTPEEKALAQRVFGSLLDCERPTSYFSPFCPPFLSPTLFSYLRPFSKIFSVLPFFWNFFSFTLFLRFFFGIFSLPSLYSPFFFPPILLFSSY